MTYNPQTHRWEGNETSIMNWENPSTHTLPSLPTYRENHNHHHHHNNSIPTNLALGLLPTDEPPRKRSNVSPPRPALISHVSATPATLGVRVERGMVFDPERMRWLKLDPRIDPSAPLPAGALCVPDEEEEEDPFAGLADLREGFGGEEEKENFGGIDEWGIGEEFDVGPGFVKRQRTEEGEWRRRVELWMADRGLGESWRWAIREVAREYSGGHSGR